MSGNNKNDPWVKMRAALTSDPKLISMAVILAASDAFRAWLGMSKECLDAFLSSPAGMSAVESVAVTSLLRLWAVTRRDGVVEGEDVILSHATPATVDRLAQTPGFAAAMGSVGWIVFETGMTARFPKLNAHIASPAEKSREKANERQRRYRERLKEKASCVTSPVTSPVAQQSLLTEQNRTEESKGITPLTIPSSPEAAVPPSVPVTSPQQPPTHSREERQVEPAEPAVLTFPCHGAARSWDLTAGYVAELSALYPALDVVAECRKALAWCGANPAKQKTAGGMKRFLVNWLNAAQNSGRAAPRADAQHAAGGAKSAYERMRDAAILKAGGLPDSPKEARQ